MRPPLSVDLALDPGTIRMFILKAKSLSADVEMENAEGHGDSIEFDAERLEDSHHHDGLAEEESEDLTEEELRSLMDDLNADEAAALVAVAWIGRGDFDANDYQGAVKQALERAESATSSYLMGMPLLAEHLESGLDALGV